MRVVDILLPATGCSLLVALLITIVRRRLHREYPFFFSYVVFSLLNTIFLFVASSNSRIYPYAYWLSIAVGAVLVLFALNEILYRVLYRFYCFWWFRLIFPSIVAGTCLVAMRHALSNPRSTQVLMSMIWYVSGAVSLIQFGVFLIFMLLAMVFHLSCRRPPFSIALGFALASMGDWTFYALTFRSGYSLLARYAPPVGFLCASALWLYSVSIKPPAQPKQQLGSTAQEPL